MFINKYNINRTMENKTIENLPNKTLEEIVELLRFNFSWLDDVLTDNEAPIPEIKEIKTMVETCKEFIKRISQ